jgi:hypothetical protein
VHDATGGFSAALAMLSIVCVLLLGLLLVLKRCLKDDALQ